MMKNSGLSQSLSGITITLLVSIKISEYVLCTGADSLLTSTPKPARLQIGSLTLNNAGIGGGLGAGLGAAVGGALAGGPGGAIGGALGGGTGGALGGFMDGGISSAFKGGSGGAIGGAIGGLGGGTYGFLIAGPPGGAVAAGVLSALGGGTGASLGHIMNVSPSWNSTRNVLGQMTSLVKGFMDHSIQNMLHGSNNTSVPPNNNQIPRPFPSGQGLGPWKKSGILNIVDSNSTIDSFTLTMGILSSSLPSSNVTLAPIAFSPLHSIRG